MSLAGKKVVVVGGSSGIGRAAALAFAQEGAAVMIGDIDVRAADAMRDAVAGIDRGIEPHTQAARGMELADGAGRGAEGEGIFRIDAAFDGMAFEHNVLLGEGQRRTRSNADLLADDVDAGDGFGHRMLHLQAGVHLEEVEVALLVNEKQIGRASCRGRG